MSKIFISYSRSDNEFVKILSEDAEVLGFSVWYDKDLSGGQIWWDQILNAIRECDIFLFVLSEKSLSSTACRRESKYAQVLNKSIVPVLAKDGVSTNLLPPELSKFQFIDYRVQDREAALRLARSLKTITPSPELPNPLPDAPEVPISYLGTLTEKVDIKSTLSYEDQSALLLDLKKGMTEEDNAKDAKTLLRRLRKRRDLFASIGDQIDELLASSTDEQVSKRSSSNVAPARTSRVTEVHQEREQPRASRSYRPQETRRKTVQRNDDNLPAEGGVKKFSTTVMIVLGVCTLFIPLVGLVGGIIGLATHEQKTQGGLLVGFSIIMGIIWLVSSMSY